MWNIGIVGHEEQIAILDRINDTSVPLLIHGSRGVGKSTTAIAFLKKFANQLDASDLLKVGKERKFNMEIARIIGKFSNLTPKNAKKAILIQNIEEASQPVINAVLKTMEELSENSIAIITSSNIYKLPKTIRDRCFSIYLPPLNREQTISVTKLNFPHIAEMEEDVLNIFCGYPGMLGPKYEDDVILVNLISEFTLQQDASLLPKICKYNNVGKIIFIISRILQRMILIRIGMIKNTNLDCSKYTLQQLMDALLNTQRMASSEAFSTGQEYMVAAIMANVMLK